MARGDTIIGSAVQRQPRTRPALAACLAIAAAALVPAVAGAADESLPSPNTTTSPDGTPFTSSKFGYSLLLPAGWQAVPEAPEWQDLFVGPVGRASFQTGGPSEPGDTLEGRVAINRGDLGSSCQSDPAADLPTTIGGEDALEWTWECGGWTYLGINMLHDAQRLRFQIGMPPGAEAEAQALLDRMAGSVTFADAASEPAANEADLAAIDAALQGTFETAWHPVQLEAATLEAAGIAPRFEFIGTTGSVRWAIKFQNGLLTQYEGDDGGPYQIGWQGTYRLVDDHTIEATDISSGYPEVLDFTLRDGILTIDVISDAYPDPADLAAATGIYETLPFTKVP